MAAFELDRRALLVSLVVALVSAVLFGLAPAIRATRADLTAVMKATDAAGFGRRRRWGRARAGRRTGGVSVVLLVVATFIYRGFHISSSSGPGFRTDHLLMMSLAPKPAGLQRGAGEAVLRARRRCARGSSPASNQPR